MKLKLDDLKTLIVVAAATASAIFYFVPDKIFRAEVVEIVKRIDANESRLNGIDTAYLEAELGKLAEKYGHTNCYRMSHDDKGKCLWLKEALSRYRR